VRGRMGGMNNELSKWWWLPSVLFVLAAVGFLIKATYRNAPFWLTIAGVFFGVALLNFLRMRPRK
jgi:hypothetical protein